MNYLLIFLIFVPVLLKAEYTKFEWNDCGSREIVLNNMDFRPMPILHPGLLNFDLKVTLKRDLVGKLKTSFSITRKVSGVSLPIRCYLASGVYVGSCTYNDACNDLKVLLSFVFPSGACPEFLSVFGIDCTCPLKVKAGTFELANQGIPLPDFSNTIFNFMAVGDFDIKIVASDEANGYACFNIKFTAKPSSQG